MISKLSVHTASKSKNLSKNLMIIDVGMMENVCLWVTTEIAPRVLTVNLINIVKWVNAQTSRRSAHHAFIEMSAVARQLAFLIIPDLSLEYVKNT